MQEQERQWQTQEEVVVLVTTVVAAVFVVGALGSCSGGSGT